MNLVESMLYNAGTIDREEYLMSEEVQLLEGIKNFKVSKRFEKTIDNIEKKMKKVEDAAELKSLKSLVTEMRKARDEFEDLEQRYAEDPSKVDKKDLKKQFNEAKKKYSALLTKVTKDNMKTALKSAGVLALVVGSLAALHVALGGEIPKEAESVKDRMMSGKHSPMGVDDKATDSILNKLKSSAGKMNLDQVSKIGSKPGAM